MNLNNTISVVIPSTRVDSTLTSLLQDLRVQTIEHECIVVVQGDYNDFSELRRMSNPLSKMRIFQCDTFSASMARNIGLLEACGEVVLFLDDDVRILDRHFLEKHAVNYEGSSVSGIYGQVLEVGEKPTMRPDPSIIETDWGWNFLPPNYGRRCRTRNGGAGNLSVRREWAINIGGMDSWFERGARREETEFNLRYTKRYGPLLFVPEASLVHLSADGGSRNWGRMVGTVPMHHIVGHWYFFLCSLRDRTLGCWGIFFELRHISIALLRNPQSGGGLFTLARNSIRSVAGFGIALSRIVRGPRRIVQLSPDVYREK